MMKFLLLAGVALGLSACAIPTRQTDSFLEGPRDIPDQARIEGVPFIEQDTNHCGPASLAMVLAHAGRPIPVEQLASEVYTPGKKGSLQADLIGAVRRNGMMAVEVSGVRALLREVAAGHPVVAFENQGLSWYPKWHYSVVIGYDLEGPDLIVHSGSDAATRRSLRKFERSWKDSDYWGLVVLPPGRLAATADDLGHATAAAGLEQVGKSEEAEAAYASILKKWPVSLGALIGLGNVRFARGDFQGASGFLSRAVRAHPRSGMAWHNLATAQGAARLPKLARVSAERALAVADAAEAPGYRESLKEWLRSRGTHAGGMCCEVRSNEIPSLQ